MIDVQVNEKRDLFLANIDDEKLLRINALLNTDNNCSIVDTYATADINTDVSLFGKRLTDSAKTTFGMFNPSNTNNPKKKNTKVWFNDSCKTSRAHYHTCRRSFLSRKTNGDREEMTRASKQYEKVIRNAKLNFKRAFKKAA
ncbi:hypothetical protein ACF0H5_004627 [Mactra antiquata]